MGKGRRADIWRLRVQWTVDELGDVMTDRGQTIQTTLGEHLVAELELEVGDHRRQVAIAGPLAEAVYRPLDVACPRLHRGERVGDGATGVVVAVDADDGVTFEVGDDVGDGRADLMRERATVRVAQHEMAGAGFDGRFEDPQAELGVGGVACRFFLKNHGKAKTLKTQQWPQLSAPALMCLAILNPEK